MTSLVELPELVDITGKIDDKKFKFRIEELTQFLFPRNLQHPLSNGRLYAFGECGPLDSNGCLRSGFHGSHVVMEYELEEMCMQYEREDLVQIYLHNPNDLGSLTSAEQDMMISQADGSLKKAKGKAMLGPPLTRNDIAELFEDLVDPDGFISFHEAQKKIIQFRQNRLKEKKKVFPSISTGKKKPVSAGGTAIMLQSSHPSARPRKMKYVSDSIAPTTMFLKLKGQTNSDIIEETTRQLNAHGFKIIGIDDASKLSAPNIRVLRSVGPQMKDPLEGTRAEWNNTAALKGTGLGSSVKVASSSTTWKRGTTVY